MYSQTLLYRNAPYRIPYAFGMKSLNLEIFAGYIGIPRYKLLRNEVSRFFGVFQYNKVGKIGGKR